MCPEKALRSAGPYDAGNRKMMALVSLRQASLRVRDRILLKDITWEVRIGEHWAVVGPNGAGKSTLVRALIGDVAVVRGEIFPPEPARLRQQAACLSFEHQRRLIAQEDRQDECHAFSGRFDGGSRVGDLIRLPRHGAKPRLLEILKRIRIEPLLDRRIRDLSSGEMRRFQIGLALGASPHLLILDEPYEGLDPEYRVELAKIINELMDLERAVVLVTHHRSEIPPNATHVIGVKAGRVVFQGRREDMLEAKRMGGLYALPAPPLYEMPDVVNASAWPRGASAEVLIELRNVTVRHQGTCVFEKLSWTVKTGQHWAVCGPNGSGKSTLLSLIVGDHPQAYANSVRVFGQLRGSAGIRETKAGIGFVSAALQMRYRKAVTAAEVVLSGFFDSVGLYRRASPAQQAAAQSWMNSFAIQGLAGKNYHHLSQGEQRMVLLARSMVKPPRLLVLDEPCQGLDTGNRRLILKAVDRIAAAGSTTVLFVSHHPDEMPACITHFLILIRESNRPSRAVVSYPPRYFPAGFQGNSTRS
jgi:molybdate transport system ATP-binding protein